MSTTFFKAAGLFALALGAAELASAQDRIYIDNGKVIDAKVKEVNQRSIVYRRWDNQDGADYVLTRREVERIVYENGTEEVFEQQQQRSRMPMPPRPGRNMRSRDDDRDEPRSGSRRRHADPAYGRNILSIAGIQMTNESVAGVGIHYERMLDRDGIISFYLPVAFSFYQDNDYNYYGSQYPGTGYEANRVFTTFYPGIKFYPGGSARRVSYSVGPSFALGFGTKFRSEEYYNQLNGQYNRTVTEENVFRAGFIVNNGLNIQATPHLYIGTELGLGIAYYESSDNNSSVYNQEPMVQFNFKIGYRF
jgi:hypothetical protein